MLARADRDIVDVNPDVVTFLLGVNDVWHRYSGVNNTDEMMEANYREILKKVKEGTHARIMIMQPYTVGERQSHMRAEVERIHPIIKRLADEFADAYMPLDDILQAAENEPSYYAGDGVHPTNEGAAFIGENYVKYVTPLIDELVGE
jgi:lysophospholipase L1-like esterase